LLHAASENMLNAANNIAFMNDFFIVCGF